MPFKNKIIYDETFPGNWRKVIVKRGAGSLTTTDPYLYTPEKLKLRSSVEFFNFIQKHPEYWQDFNATKINVDRSTDGTKLTLHTRKIIKFLELVNSGTTVEEASQLVDSIKPPRPKKLITEKFRRQDYSKDDVTRPTKSNNGSKSKIGPKSRIGPKSQIGPKSNKIIRIGLKSKMGNLIGLNRDIVMKLEKHFYECTCKPTASKMMEWAKEMNVDSKSISDWFNKKWHGKLDYEARKSKDPDAGDPMRTRGLQKFDPDVATDAFTDTMEDAYEIEQDNAEDDK